MNGESKEPQSVTKVIVSAAAEVDRPIFYAVAVIVAGFLPIYALSGPSGELFKPMADTTIFALVGSLLIALTLLPVLCAWVLRRGVRERRNIIFDKIRQIYTVGLDAALKHPWATTAASVVIFAASLLLIPSIGAEFMPHLDEGSLWVRATMPSTISFEEASKISPQIRAILRSFPAGHRRDLGARTAGRRHRSDRLLQRRVLRRAETVRSMDRPDPDKSATDRSDRTRSWRPSRASSSTTRSRPRTPSTRRRPVSRARSPSRSSVPISTSSRQRANAIKAVLQKVPGIDEISVVRELGQPSLTVTPDREKIARYGLNVADINGLIEAAVGGAAATQVVQGERLFDLVVRLEPRFRETPEAIGNILVATPGGQQIPLKELADIREASGASFIYREDNSALHRRAVLDQEPRSGRRGRRRAAPGGQSGLDSDGLSDGVGRRVRELHRLAQAASGHRPGDDPADLHAAVHALFELQVPDDHRRWRCCSPRRSAACWR